MRQQLEHLDQLLPLIKEKDEVIVIDKGWYQVVDYVYVDKDTFSHPLLHECRGVKFDRDGEIIARPFHKFFNLGEKQQEHEINWSAPHTTMLKMDGSMIHTVFDKDHRVRAMTRKGETDVAAVVQDLFFPECDDYSLFSSLCMKYGRTPIFEFTSPSNRIVVPYTSPMLTLLAVRNIKSGSYMHRATLERYGHKYGIPVVRNFISSPDEMIKKARKFTEDEGIVIQFDDGHMLKIKADAYVIKHRAVSDLDSKKKVLAVVFSDTVDDFLPLLGELDRTELAAFRDAVNYQITQAAMAMEAVYRAHGHLERKLYAAIIKENISGKFSSVAFAAYDGKDVREATKRAFTRNLDYIQAKWRGE